VITSYYLRDSGNKLATPLPPTTTTGIIKIALAIVVQSSGTAYPQVFPRKFPVRSPYVRYNFTSRVP